MLVIVMHNNQEYLQSLSQIAKREGITDFTIVKNKGIGMRLIGGNTSFIFTKGKVLDAYEKAFVAVVRGEEKIKHFLDVIENNSDLDMSNIEDKGFICTVPFHYIEYIGLESVSHKEEEMKMRIVDFLKEDRITLKLKAGDKEEAIKEMACLLGNAKEVIDFDLFLKDVFERESLNTTGIGEHIAIPHARTDAVKDFVIAFGRASEGIEFNSLDKKPAKFIFLMGTPKEKGLNSYLKILAHLTRLLKRESFKEALIKASGPKEVIEEFRKVEK